MLKAIIVDDEEKNREGLARMIDQFCHDVAVVGKAESASAAKKAIQEHQPDLVFLDIEMPGGNGFSLLEEMPNPNFQVIFTTAHADYAIKAIKFAALDYLLKPININELKTAVEKAIINMNAAQDGSLLKKKIEVLKDNRKNEGFDFEKIALPTSDGIDFYEIREILRCEADRAYCKFHMLNGQKVVVSKPLKEFEDLLEECNFFRVHKSNMINLNQIKKYVKGKGGYLILSDDSHVDVSVRRKEALMDVLSNPMP
ncbi:MAG TPA: DNA-binding response regulator [Flavobacteriales bacterium]|nr:DNA-binding response regulator [Crocinitomicaceae bacterium]HAE29857.1 DNA-binding response regulator [Flavobacteriales bacterium]|tara:strand:+ start:3132 stop:3899 length:768 start_codon:yes stop_codon:yes gene_type:complete